MIRVVKIFSREVMYTLLLIIGVTGLLYLLFCLMPGSLSVNAVWYKEYIQLLTKLLTFRFGVSPITGLDINTIIFPAFRNTLILTIGAMVISVMIAVPIGIFASFRGFKGVSWPLTMFSYIVSSIPVFFLGYVVIFLVARNTGIIPIYFPRASGRGNPVLSFILPIIVLGIGNDSVSEIVRLISNELGRVMASDYVIASKGRGESVLKSSFNEGVLLPMISIIFSRVPFLIGGAIIVEYVFNWPGMGRLAFQSTLSRDLPVLGVIAFLSVITVRAGMILKEILFTFINPKSQ